MGVCVMASDFKLSDCYVKTRKQPCWDCVNACGGCEWTERDPNTHKIRFEPVPGWDAEPVRKMVKNGKREWRLMESYAIRSCPKFVKEERHGETGD